MADKDFNNLLEKLKKLWYYVIRTDDWDRYLWEVFIKDEMVCIATSSEEAYMKLWEFVQDDFSQQPITND